MPRIDSLIYSILLIAELSGYLYAQTTDDYRSKISGNWNSVSSWERYNGSSWVNATKVPAYDNANVVTIQSGHTITFNTLPFLVLDQVIVNGTLNVSDGAAISLAYTSGYDLQVNGTLSIASSGGEVGLRASAKIIFNPGSTYKHYCDGGAIPIADWSPSSLCEIIGLRDKPLNSLSTEQDFGNLTWNCLTQSFLQEASFTYIQGNLNITNGGIDLKIIEAPRDVRINGNLTILNGILDLGSDFLFAERLYIEGDIRLSRNQAIQKSYTNGTSEIIFYKVGNQHCMLDADDAIDGTRINYRVSSFTSLQMDITSSNFNVSSGRTFTLEGSFDSNGHFITGAGNFISNDGSILTIRNYAGINTSGADGEIQVSGTRTFSPLTSYYFTGENIVNGGDALTNAKNITIDHPGSNAVNLITDLTVTGSINLVSGYIHLSIRTLTLGPSATLNETSENVIQGLAGSKIITTRNINNVSNSNIAGMGLILTTTANLGSTTIERHHDPVTACFNTGIKRWYKITPTNNTSLNATLVFTYSGYELNGLGEDYLRLYSSVNFTVWQKLSSILNTTANTLTLDGLNSLPAYFTLSDITHRLAYSAYIKTFLQGPYSTGAMLTTLNSSGLIPLTQPYNTSPWSYPGTESVQSMPAEIVDWVLVEVRSNPTTLVAKRAGLLKNDGTIVEVDGMNRLEFPGVANGVYYTVIRHRNHLPIMSNTNDVQVTTNPSMYDFTTAQTKAYGTNPMKNLASGVYGMIAGDINMDGTVKYNLSGNDRALIYTKIGGANINTTANGYFSEDLNMDGIVKYNLSGNDRAILYQSIGGGNINSTVVSQVP